MARIYDLLIPTASSKSLAVPLAPRLHALQGTRLGILSNQKVNADELLESLAVELQSRHQVRMIIKRTKQIQSQAAPEVVMSDLVSLCDAVIQGVGD
ncbi:MAG: hypothetical protein ACE5JU_04245 [Candidatus Binatia bacterium]